MGSGDSFHCSWSSGRRARDHLLKPDVAGLSLRDCHWEALIVGVTSVLLLTASFASLWPPCAAVIQVLSLICGVFDSVASCVFLQFGAEVRTKRGVITTTFLSRFIITTLNFIAFTWSGDKQWRGGGVHRRKIRKCLSKIRHESRNFFTKICHCTIYTSNHSCIYQETSKPSTFTSLSSRNNLSEVLRDRRVPNITIFANVFGRSIWYWTLEVAKGLRICPAFIVFVGD